MSESLGSIARHFGRLPCRHTAYSLKAGTDLLMKKIIDFLKAALNAKYL
jgi:hypothetical protein